jgi:hypothetical protein
MPRITHTVQVPLGSIGDYSVGDAADFTFLAADVANMEQFVSTGKEMILARNVGGGPFLITVNSVNDPFNRTGDIVDYSLGALEFAMFGPFDRTGWKQVGGFIFFEANNVAIEFAVIRLP